MLYKSESGDIRLYNVEERSARDIVSVKESFADERLENVGSMDDIFISQKLLHGNLFQSSFGNNNITSFVEIL